MAKRVQYVLLDASNRVKARVTPREPDVAPVLEPWMLHKLQTHEWRLQKWETDEVGETVETHGYCDWKAIAEALAEALRETAELVEPLSDEEWEEMGEPEREEVHEHQAKVAKSLQDFDMAQFEVMVLNPEGEEPEPIQIAGTPPGEQPDEQPEPEGDDDDG